jgi:DNA-binding GntR family transcriptional regulator
MNEELDAALLVPQQKTLHARVTDILRDKIIDGILRPGTPISERDLCEELQISRTPIARSAEDFGGRKSGGSV